MHGGIERDAPEVSRCRIAKTPRRVRVHELVDRCRDHETEQDGDDLFERREGTAAQQLTAQNNEQQQIEARVLIATLNEIEAGRRRVRQARTKLRRPLACNPTRLPASDHAPDPGYRWQAT